MTDQIIQLLIAERERINLAIAALQGSAGKRRGRPPKSESASINPPAPPTKRSRPKFTKAQREAQAERMRQIWAKRKKQEAKERKSASAAAAD